MAVYTTPRTWVTSEVDTAAFFNAHISANTKASIARSRGINTTSLTGSVAGTTTSSLNFDAVACDPLAMWSAGTPARLTVPYSGYYTICGYVGSSGGTATLFVRKNGTTTILTGETGANPRVGAYDVALVAGDYVELCVTTGASTFFLAIYPNNIGTVLALAVDWVSP